MVAYNFDATQVAPDEGRMAVPKGWYNVMMTESERKPVQDGSTDYLRTVYTIVDGQYKGMKLYNNFNDKHANPVTREIAAKQFSALMHAVGIMQITDTTQLHNRPMKVKVKLRVDATGQFDDQNDITAYKPMSFETPANAAAPAATSTGFTPPAAGFTPPPLAATGPAAGGWAAPAAAPAPAPVAAAPVYEMAPDAGATREAFHAAGWSDEQLIQHNKMRIVQPAAPAPAPVPAPAPAPAPAAEAQPWAAGAVAQPWAAAAAAVAPAAAAAPPATVAAPAPAAPAPAPQVDPAVAAAQAASPPWGAPPAGAAPF